MEGHVFDKAKGGRSSDLRSIAGTKISGRIRRCGETRRGRSKANYHHERLCSPSVRATREQNNSSSSHRIHMETPPDDEIAVGAVEAVVGLLEVQPGVPLPPPETETPGGDHPDEIVVVQDEDAPEELDLSASTVGVDPSNIGARSID
jgi:hypothetical protein